MKPTPPAPDQDPDDQPAAAAPDPETPILVRPVPGPRWPKVVTRRPAAAAPDPETPILVRPVPRPEWPKVITTARVLTGVQVALVMITGNCSFGIPLASAIAWPVEVFNWHEDPGGIAILWAWVIGFAAILTYACFTNTWAGEADRRARTTIIIGTAVLVGLTALTGAAFAFWEPALAVIVLIAAAPSLIVQAIVLRCVFGPEGRRWFERERLEQVVTEP